MHLSEGSALMALVVACAANNPNDIAPQETTAEQRCRNSTGATPAARIETPARSTVCARETPIGNRCGCGQRISLLQNNLKSEFESKD